MAIRHEENAQRHGRGGTRVITPLQDSILDAHRLFHFLTPDQAQRYVEYQAKRYIEKQYAALTQAGLLMLLDLPGLGRYGRPAAVYHLTAQGLRYLHSLGREVWPRFHAGELGHIGYLHLRHALVISDVLIAVSLLCRHTPQLTLRALRHDRDLRRKPVKVAVPDGPDGAMRTVQVVPDAFVDLGVGTKRKPLLFEVDRQTESARTFRTKIRSLVSYAQGPYQEAMQAKSLTICILAAPADKPPYNPVQHRDTLRRWLAAELTALGTPTGVQDLFRIACADPATMPPEELFLAPHWYRPGSDQPVPLLDGVSEDAS